MKPPSLLRRCAEALLDVSVVGSFGAPGLHFRREGFADPDLSLDLSGRVVIVTGASAGLGEALSALLVARGARVIGVCRDRTRAEASSARIEAVSRVGPTRGTFELELADLSSLDQVRALAARLTRLPAIHALVNNAGVMPKERVLTADGLELAFATNVVAPHLLIHLLVEALSASRPARIVNVTSGGMYLAKLDLERLQGRTGRYDGVEAYAQTKRAEVVLTERWAQRLRARGVTVNAVHPGWAATPGVARSLPVFDRVMRPLLRTAAEGADGIAWVAVAPELEGSTGRLYFDRAERRTEVLGYARTTEETARELLALCDRCAGVAA